MNSVIPVIFSTDENYAPYCSVAIASMLKNCDPKRKYIIYILCTDTRADFCRVLEGMSRPGVEIRCTDISDLVADKTMHTTGHFTQSMYYRLFAPWVLPQYDKALYLDCDVVVRGDVTELFDTELNDCLLGAVLDDPMNTPEWKPYMERLGDGVPQNEYFNSGVLLINLRQMRQEHMDEKFTAFMETYTNLKYPDQDILNAVCKGRVHYFPRSWNKLRTLLDEEFEAGTAKPEEIKLVHYVSARKPWNYPFRPADLLFYQSLEQSPYRDWINNEIVKVGVREMVRQRDESFWIKSQTMAEGGEVGISFLLKLIGLWFKGKLKKNNEQKDPS